MSAVCPVMMVWGTWPRSCHMSWAVYERCRASNSMQSSQRHLGQQLEVSFQPVPFFNSLIADLAAFEKGEYGSMDFTQQSASLSFFQNLPRTCAFALSMTMVLGTPTSFIMVDNMWWASLSFLIGYAQTHWNSVQ